MWHGLIRVTFGDGSDGDVVISVDTTLTGDMNYNNLTINAGVTLYPDGYVIYVKNTLTLDGTINRNGNNGGLVTGGAGLPTRSVGGSGKGGQGYYNACENGESVNGIANSIGGGTYHGCVGGITDTYTELTADNVGELITNASNMKGGPGGGGGGAWPSKPNGAGGGSGGGVIYIEAQSIHISSTGLITAAGGNHYSVYAANSFSGGGGGGAIALLYDNMVNSGTLSVAAGSHSTLEDTTPWATSGIIYPFEIEAAAAAVKSGRPLRHSTGATVSGGIGCGMGKRR